MRQYRLLEIATQYDQYLRKFYRIHDNFNDLSYDGLFSMVVEDILGPADFIHRHLRNMGIESKLVFYNNRNLQRKILHRILFSSQICIYFQKKKYRQ